MISEQVLEGKLYPDPPGASGYNLPLGVCLGGRELGFHTPVSVGHWLRAGVSKLLGEAKGPLQVQRDPYSRRAGL